MTASGGNTRLYRSTLVEGFYQPGFVDGKGGALVAARHNWVLCFERDQIIAQGESSGSVEKRS